MFYVLKHKKDARMNEIFIMYANHKKSSLKRKVLANLEKDVCGQK